MGLQIQVLNASTSREIEAAFAILVRDRPDALFVGGDPFFSAGASNWHNWRRASGPRNLSVRDFTEAGGLMSYGTNLTKHIVRSASIPAASSRAPSLRTCRSCSQASSSCHQPQDRPDARPEVPPTLLARADEVIE